MYLEIVSPEATLFQGEVDSVTVPGTAGIFQILNNHAPIVSTLKEGVVVIEGALELSEEQQAIFQQQDASKVRFSITGGAVELQNNKLILLADA